MGGGGKREKGGDRIEVHLASGLDGSESVAETTLQSGGNLAEIALWRVRAGGALAWRVCGRGGHIKVGPVRSGNSEAAAIFRNEIEVYC